MNKRLYKSRNDKMYNILRNKKYCLTSLDDYVTILHAAYFGRRRQKAPKAGICPALNSES